MKKKQKVFLFSHSRHHGERFQPAVRMCSNTGELLEIKSSNVTFASRQAANIFAATAALKMQIATLHDPNYKFVIPSDSDKWDNLREGLDAHE